MTDKLAGGDLIFYDSMWLLPNLVGDDNDSTAV